MHLFVAHWPVKPVYVHLLYPSLLFASNCAKLTTDINTLCVYTIVQHKTVSVFVFSMVSSMCSLVFRVCVCGYIEVHEGHGP